MAVNHADGTLFGTAMLCPIAAGLGASSAGAGWWMLVFVAAGVPVGFAVAYAGRRLVYSLLHRPMKIMSETTSSWTRWFVGIPSFLVYLVLPSAISITTVLGTLLGAVWLTRYLF